MGAGAFGVGALFGLGLDVVIVLVMVLAFMGVIALAWVLWLLLLSVTGRL